ncbi:MAG: VCBS repeat-containing protein [Planctomycetes bacterium]|nr:VCBS repeat-containing protein [Planctomycetota bacterium]
MRHRKTTAIAALFLLPPLVAQLPIGGELQTQMAGAIRMRLLAFGIPIAQSTAPLNLQGHIRTLGTVNFVPQFAFQLPSTQIQAMRVESFTAAAADTSLVLQGLNIDLRDFRFEVSPCVGTLGTATVTPAGIAQVLTDQTDISARAEGRVILSGGTPPFAFNQTIDLATLGTPIISLFGIYSFQANAQGVIEQHLDLNSPPPIPFDFAGFTLDFQVLLNGGANSVDLVLPVTGSDATCCANAVPNGTLFDRGTAADLSAPGTGIAVADFDCDGLHDLAMPGFNSVRIHRALGRGLFAPFVELPLLNNAISPSDLIAGDFDGDGDPDLASLSAGTGSTVQILINDGTGTFTVTGAFASGVTPVKLAVGDIDNDGDLDVAVASESLASPGVNLLHNQGNGTFGAPVLLTFTSGLADVELADLDGDGDLDVVGPLRTQDFFIFRRNNDDGTFANPVGFNMATRGGDSPRDVALADLDGDGDLDAAVVNSLSNNLILIRNTNGQFSSAAFLTVPIPGSSQPRFLQLSDLDRDGDRDVIVADFPVNNGTGPTLLATFANDGAGVVTTPVTYTVAGLGRALAIGDFDADADPDVAVQTNLEITKVLINGCTGTTLAGALASTFGTGCPGSLGIPVLTPRNRPVVGTRFVSRLTNVVPGAAAFVVGFSDQVWNGQPLPLPLGFLGLAPSCNALVAADAIDFVVHGGVAEYGLTVPADVGFVGLPVFLQGLCIDPALPTPVQAAMSNGARAVVGL